MKNNFAWLACVVFLLSGCEEKVVTHTGVLTMEVNVVNLQSKSNSKVDLADLYSGKVYRDQRLSCSKQKASKVKVGTVWDVRYQDVKYGDRYYTELLNVESICEKSQ